MYLRHLQMSYSMKNSQQNHTGGVSLPDTSQVSSFLCLFSYLIISVSWLHPFQNCTRLKAHSLALGLQLLSTTSLSSTEWMEFGLVHYWFLHQGHDSILCHLSCVQVFLLCIPKTIKNQKFRRSGKEGGRAESSRIVTAVLPGHAGAQLLYWLLTWW